jgi:iron complex transport system substrate-binding protein
MAGLKRLAVALLATGSCCAAVAAPRVVTLAPHLAELVCAAGACEDLVGVSAWSDTPARVAGLPQIGDAQRVNLEAVLALKPDLVLAWDGGTPPETVARLRALGLRVESVRVRELDDVAAALEAIGAWLGTPARARAAAAAYRARLSGLRSRWAHAAPLRVVYQIETAPAYTVNRDSPISQAFAVCGGVNVFAGLPRLAAPVSAEAMLAAQPQAVFYGAQENAAAMREYWARLAATPAARAGNFFPVPADRLARATPRLLDAIEEVCADLDLARQRLSARRASK